MADDRRLRAPQLDSKRHISRGRQDRFCVIFGVEKGIEISAGVLYIWPKCCDLASPERSG